MTELSFSESQSKQNAVLDTSFWTIGYRAEILAYLFDFFVIWVPSAVEKEITATNPDFPKMEYPDAKLYCIFKENQLLNIANPTSSLKLFGTGEATAISLAMEKGYILLINDRRPCQYAKSLGLKVITVPSFITLLYSQKKIHYGGAKSKLSKISRNTSRSLILEGKKIIEKIATMRGEF